MDHRSNRSRRNRHRRNHRDAAQDYEDSGNNRRMDRDISYTSNAQQGLSSSRGRHRWRKGKGNRGGNQYRSGSDGHNQPRNQPSKSASTADAPGGSGNSLDIPGFYYDPEKKKYFKILPGHCSNQKVVTKKNINEKEAENKRLSLINKTGEAKRPKIIYTKSSKDNHFSQPSYIGRTRHQFNNLWNILNNHTLGNITSISYRDQVQENNISLCRSTWVRKVFVEPVHHNEKLEHMSRMIPNDGQNKLLCLWSIKGLLMQRIQMLDVGNISKEGMNRVKVDIKPVGAAVSQSFSKISHLCWAPFGDDETEHNILYTTTCFIGNNSSQAMLRRLDASSPEEFRNTEFSLGSHATWTCAWDRFNKKFSVGSEKCALFLDVQTRRMWELYTNRSDVLAQTFSKQGCTLLYSGTRKGEILTHDTRTHSNKPSQCFRHQSTISHLYHTNDMNCLVVADFSGKVKKWDLRKRSVVCEYEEHHNEYTQIPLHVDKHEKYLFAAGQDCYIRAWDFSSGRLLNTIPPPHPASRDNIPSLCYLDNLGNNDRIPGILLGMLDELHFYSMW